jgi:hypothetical protein
LWLETTTVDLPFKSRMMPRTWAAILGSKPAVGSSSRITGGWPISAWAIDTRLAMPCESAPQATPQVSGSPTRSSTERASVSGEGSPESRARYTSSAPTGQVGGSTASCGSTPTLPFSAPGAVGSTPITRRLPRVG